MAALSDDISYVDGGVVEYEPSIFAHFARVLKSSPSNIAIRVAHQPWDYLNELAGLPRIQSISDDNSRPLAPPCLSWTYEQLHHAAIQVVHSLNIRNVTAGSTIVCLVPNGIEWIIVLWAAVLGKFALSSLDFGALTAPRSHELQRLLHKINPDVIFVPGKDGANSINLALESQRLTPKVKVMFHSPSSKQDQSSSTNDAATWTTLRDMINPHVPEPIRKSIEEQALLDDHGRIALILFTSGTSAGTPKGCPHTVREILHNFNQHWESGATRQPRRLLQTANFRIIAPTLALTAWTSGGTVVLPSAAFNPQAMLAALCDERFAISFALFVPAQLHALVAQANFAAASEQIFKRGDLKEIAIGGDIITEELFNKARKAFPGVKVQVGHGMTEGGASVMWPAEIKSAPYYAGIAPIGKVNKGTRLKIAATVTDVVDNNEQERGATLKRGELGELHLWSEGFIRGYLDGTNAHNFYTDENGHKWFDTGDMALIDKEGWVYILGRKKDIIKRAGIPITPGALESSLDTYLHSQTCVLGVPHPILGQEPVAIVRSLGQSTKEDAQQHVKATFGPDYALGNVFTLEELGLNEFPMNATGKILKFELLDRLASLK